MIPFALILAGLVVFVALDAADDDADPSQSLVKIPVEKRR